jgi:hypothetical protein
VFLGLFWLLRAFQGAVIWGHFWFVNEIVNIFENVRVLCYAVGMKMFLPVCGFQDFLKILIYLNVGAESW